MSAHQVAQSVPYAFKDDTTVADALDRRPDWVRPPPVPIKSVRQRSSLRGIVYFIGPRRGQVKIGFTTDLPARLTRIQAHSPLWLTVLASVEGTVETERNYHRQFNRHRLHGEWFTRSPEIDAEIARLKG